MKSALAGGSEAKDLVTAEVTGKGKTAPSKNSGAQWGVAGVVVLAILASIGYFYFRSAYVGGHQKIPMGGH